MQSIMGHLIIKNEFDHYHLLDIPNNCVKKFKDFRSYRKVWPFHILRESIAQNVFQMVFSGVKFNSKTFLFSSPWPKNASKGLKIKVFEKH